MQITIDVSSSGPLFDGRAAAAVTAFLDEAKQEVGQQGLSDLHFYMDAYFKHPTPYYETQVLSERQGNDVVIHDRGIVYGPWLAGVGSRNQTTRFKGYAHWRRTRQGLEAKAPALLQHVLQKYLERMQ